MIQENRRNPRGLLAQLLILCILTTIVAGLGLALIEASKLISASLKPSEIVSEPTLVSVSVDRAVLTEYQGHIEAFGRIQINRDWKAYSQLTGNVAMLSPQFREGQAVEEGSELVRLSTPQLTQSARRAQQTIDLNSTRLDILREQIEATTATFNFRQSVSDLQSERLTRVEGMFEREITNRSALESAQEGQLAAQIGLAEERQNLLAMQSSLNSAYGEVEKARLDLEIVQEEMRLATIRAPFDGIVQSVLVGDGEAINQGQHLGTLIDPDALELRFTLTRAQHRALLEAHSNLSGLSVRISMDDIGLSSLTATIERSLSSQQNGAQIQVVLASLSPSTLAQVEAGDFLRMEIPLRTLTDVVAVPVTAIDPQDRVFVLGADESLEERQVKRLAAQADMVYVAGLSEGERFVRNKDPLLVVGTDIVPVYQANASSDE